MQSFHGIRSRRQYMLSPILRTLTLLQEKQYTPQWFLAGNLYVVSSEVVERLTVLRSTPITLYANDRLYHLVIRVFEGVLMNVNLKAFVSYEQRIGLMNDIEMCLNIAWEELLGELNVTV